MGCREIEVRSVEQRSAIEAACTDAEAAARAAINRAHELRDMLSSAQTEQERAPPSALGHHLRLRPPPSALVTARLWLWRPVVPRIVPLLSAGAWRPRATGSQSSSLLWACVVDTSWTTKF